MTKTMGISENELKSGVVVFLDYEIKNTGNGDGWVLLKPDTHDWRCHLGNYSNVKSAKEWAIRFFMIERPQHFASQVAYRMVGTQASHDYFKFIEVLKEEGFEIPEGIDCSDTFTLMFYGKKI